MLELTNVEVFYEGVIYVLKGTSLKVADGAKVGVFGANGAGKSTLLKSVSGVIKTERGEVTSGIIDFDGKRIDVMAPDQIAKLGVTHVMEGRRLFRHLRAEESLVVAAQSNQSKSHIGENLEMVYTYFPKLRELRGKVSGYLSGGEQQMLVIGSALMAMPKLMMLDEPSLGLAPKTAELIYGILDTINKEQGCSMLVVEQNAMLGLSFVDYGYVLENGRVVLDNTAENLMKNEDMREFYLGLSELGRKSYKEVKHYRRRKRWL